MVAGGDKGAVVHDKASVVVFICRRGEISTVHNILLVFTQVILHKNISDIKVNPIEVKIRVNQKEFGGVLLGGGEADCRINAIDKKDDTSQVAVQGDSEL